MTAAAPLPDLVRRAVEELATGLAAALGDELVGVVVHGGVLRGEYRPGESITDVVVVAKHADLDRIAAVTDLLQHARYTARIETTLITEAEIDGASDAFPLLFDELRERRLVIAGTDPFAAVTVPARARRLAIERALRQSRVRLRRAIVDSGAAPEAIGGAVARRLGELRAPLHALLSLKGASGAPDLASVLDRAGAAYGVDVVPLRAPRETPGAAHGALVALLGRAIDDVDAMGDGEAPSRA